MIFICGVVATMQMPLHAAVISLPLNSYVYDNMARVSSVTMTRGDSVYTVQSNNYDSIGRLTRMGYGNGCGVSYTYKVAGSMASITASDAAGTNTFSQTLSYTTGATPSYSGNVGSIDWHGDDKVSRRYNFTYDGLGRLTSAAYTEPSGRGPAHPVTGTPSYTASYTYGPDSRPLTVRRQGVRTVAFTDNVAVPAFGEVDNLTFSYAGSRLTKVYDAAENIIYSGATDFNDGADTDTEYTYDEDGRMTSDSNKGITSIRYNAIGLPGEVKFGDGNYIINRYGADGTLLQRVEYVKRTIVAKIVPVVQPYKHETIENHIGPLTLNNKISKRLRVDTPTGFISYGTMHYYVKDYQGNVRQVVDADGVVEQDNHYYPYGMLMGESSNILLSASKQRLTFTGGINPYRFGSKEYLTTNGANLLDFTARTYDPTTLLFQTQDPKATDYTSLNSYLYCGSDPINRVDRDGKEWKYTHLEGADPKFEWVDPKDAYDKDGNLLPDHYIQPISFSAEDTNGKFNKNSAYNMGTSTATVYKANGSTEDFDACTYPSDTEKFSTVPAGRYEAKVGKHHPYSKKGYTALRMGDVGTKNFYNNRTSLNEINRAHPENGKNAWSINIHKAGIDNKTGKTNDGQFVSEGCMLIDRFKWGDFIGIFDKPDLKNSIIGIIILR